MIQMILVWVTNRDGSLTRTQKTRPEPALFLAGMDIKIRKNGYGAGMVKMGTGMGTGRVQSYLYPNPPHTRTRFVLKKFKQICKLYYLYWVDLWFELK